MNCPECGAGGAGVVKTVDTRSYMDGDEGFYYTERRKHCLECGNKFKTLEVGIDVWLARRANGIDPGSESEEESN
jgi:transcriptional regulator NrdR family protein